MDFIQFIPEQLLILVATLGGLGVLLKSTPNISDWLIPYILLVIGIVFSIFLTGVNVNAVMQGAIASFCANGINQVVKQTNKRKENN